MLCPADFLWTPSMANALKADKSIVMELDMDDPQTLQEMMRGMQDTASTPLAEALSNAEYSRLQRFAKDSFGIDIVAVAGMDPSTVSLVLLSKLLPCSMPASYEARIATEAASSNQPIEGLETVAEQLALLKKLGTDSSAGELMKFVDSFATMKAEFATLVSTFLRQDLDSLAGLIAASPMLGAQGEAFLGDRNRRWVPRLENSMASGPVFVAVGAAHLPGKSGVLELLRRAGYTVRPLN
jgi:uncharacterized protein YbaP (TraB family)